MRTPFIPRYDFTKPPPGFDLIPGSDPPRFVAGHGPGLALVDPREGATLEEAWGLWETTQVPPGMEPHPWSDTVDRVFFDAVLTAPFKYALSFLKVLGGGTVPGTTNCSAADALFNAWTWYKRRAAQSCVDPNAAWPSVLPLPEERLALTIVNADQRDVSRAGVAAQHEQHVRVALEKARQQLNDPRRPLLAIHDEMIVEHTNLRAVVIACPEHTHLPSAAAFWAETLGMTVNPEDAHQLRGGAVPVELFIEPHTAAARMRIVVQADDIRAERDRLLMAGASLNSEVWTMGQELESFVLEAPTGHLFNLVKRTQHAPETLHCSACSGRECAGFPEVAELIENRAAWRDLARELLEMTPGDGETPATSLREQLRTLVKGLQVTADQPWRALAYELLRFAPSDVPSSVLHDDLRNLVRGLRLHSANLERVAADAIRTRDARVDYVQRLHDAGLGGRGSEEATIKHVEKLWQDAQTAALSERPLFKSVVQYLRNSTFRAEVEDEARDAAHDLERIADRLADIQELGLGAAVQQLTAQVVEMNASIDRGLAGLVHGSDIGSALDTTIDQLAGNKRFGDVAAALGKTPAELAAAVAEACDGPFEALSSFGKEMPSTATAPELERELLEIKARGQQALEALNDPRNSRELPLVLTAPADPQGRGDLIWPRPGSLTPVLERAVEQGLLTRIPISVAVLGAPEDARALNMVLGEQPGGSIFVHPFKSEELQGVLRTAEGLGAGAVVLALSSEKLLTQDSNCLSYDVLVHQRRIIRCRFLDSHPLVQLIAETLAKPLPETQASVTAWATETFGPCAPLRAAARVAEEMQEFLEVLDEELGLTTGPFIGPERVRAASLRGGDISVETRTRLLKEAADVIVTLWRLFSVTGDSDVQTEINRVMDINHRRVWLPDGTGCGYRVVLEQRDGRTHAACRVLALAVDVEGEGDEGKRKALAELDRLRHDRRPAPGEGADR